MAKQQTKEQQQGSSKNLPALSPPRLPWHPRIGEEFSGLGVNEQTWKVLCEAIFPIASSPATIRLALGYCAARHLDVFKRMVHIVQIWDRKQKKMVDTIWPGIGEVRTTAHRTKQYAGRDKTEFGDMITKSWEVEGEVIEVKFPEWAQVTVYRLIEGVRCAFAGPIVYWLETYSTHKDGSPNSMWQKRPIGQLEKCAEAAALRVAFPEEVGNEYIDAEAHLQDGPQTYEQERDMADAHIKETMGTKPVEAKDITGQEPEPEPDEQPEPPDENQGNEIMGWRCTNPKCQKTVTKEPETKKGKLQCPKCLKLTMKPVTDDDIMEG